jgi:hypothetical protein
LNRIIFFRTFYLFIELCIFFELFIFYRTLYLFRTFFSFFVLTYKIACTVAVNSEFVVLAPALRSRPLCNVHI